MEKNKKTVAVALISAAIITFAALASALYTNTLQNSNNKLLGTSTRVQEDNRFWFLLKRASNEEVLYHGTPGDESQSTRVKTFTVKTGVPGKKPTPLPELVGRDYWRIIDKYESSDNKETAPYFLQLDVPVTEEVPYGPRPYTECESPGSAETDGQCNWELPGYFGLHGVAGDNTRLSSENEGSSGCIRHSDEDITYLYHTLPIGEEEIRYYVQDV